MHSLSLQSIIFQSSFRCCFARARPSCCTSTFSIVDTIKLLSTHKLGRCTRASPVFRARRPCATNIRHHAYPYMRYAVCISTRVFIYSTNNLAHNGGPRQFCIPVADERRRVAFSLHRNAGLGPERARDLRGLPVHDGRVLGRPAVRQRVALHLDLRSAVGNRGAIKCVAMRMSKLTHGNISIVHGS